MIKVAICDDHKIVREGLKQIIGVFDDFEVVMDVESGMAQFATDLALKELNSAVRIELGRGTHHEISTVIF